MAAVFGWRQTQRKHRNETEEYMGACQITWYVFQAGRRLGADPEEWR